MRRVITGKSSAGRAYFVMDGPPCRATELGPLSGYGLYEIWATEQAPLLPAPLEDPTPKLLSLMPEAGGICFRYMRLPPKSALDELERAGHNVAEIHEKYVRGLPGLGATMEPNSSGMHTTPTVDFGVVISDEVFLELDDAKEVLLKPGDTFVQNGTRHRWVNRGDAPCLVAIVMVGGTGEDLKPRMTAG